VGALAAYVVRPKYKKVPYQCNGTPAKSTDPGTWATFAGVREAFIAARDSSRYSGVGFVFADADPYVGVDIDKCRDPQTEAIDDRAVTALSLLRGAYVEISPSATGVHLIARGSIRFTGKKDDFAGVEMYRTGRYFCVTGHTLAGQP